MRLGVAPGPLLGAVARLEALDLCTQDEQRILEVMLHPPEIERVGGMARMAIGMTTVAASVLTLTRPDIAFAASQPKVTAYGPPAAVETAAIAPLALHQDIGITTAQLFKSLEDAPLISSPIVSSAKGTEEAKDSQSGNVLVDLKPVSLPSSSSLSTNTEKVTAAPQPLVITTKMLEAATVIETPVHTKELSIGTVTPAEKVTNADTRNTTRRLVIKHGSASLIDVITPSSVMQQQPTPSAPDLASLGFMSLSEITSPTSDAISDTDTNPDTTSPFSIAGYGPATTTAAPVLQSPTQTPAEKKSTPVAALAAPKSKPVEHKAAKKQASSEVSKDGYVSLSSIVVTPEMIKVAKQAIITANELETTGACLYGVDNTLAALGFPVTRIIPAAGMNAIFAVNPNYVQVHLNPADQDKFPPGIISVYPINRAYLYGHISESLGGLDSAQVAKTTTPEGAPTYGEASDHIQWSINDWDGTPTYWMLKAELPSKSTLMHEKPTIHHAVTHTTPPTTSTVTSPTALAAPASSAPAVVSSTPDPDSLGFVSLSDITAPTFAANANLNAQASSSGINSDTAPDTTSPFSIAGYGPATPTLPATGSSSSSAIETALSTTLTPLNDVVAPIFSGDESTSPAVASPVLQSPTPTQTEAKPAPAMTIANPKPKSVERHKAAKNNNESAWQKLLTGSVLPTAVPSEGNIISLPPTWFKYVEEANTLPGHDPAITPALIAADLRAESGMHTGEVSETGAQGIAQFEPGTWAEYDPHTSQPDTPNNPADAIPAQIRYLDDNARAARQLFGVTDIRTIQDDALAIYDAGPPAVRKAGGVPDIGQTLSYVAEIQADMSGYQDMLQTMADSISAASSHKQSSGPTTANLTQSSALASLSAPATTQQTGSSAVTSSGSLNTAQSGLGSTSGSSLNTIATSISGSGSNGTDLSGSATTGTPAGTTPIIPVVTQSDSAIPGSVSVSQSLPTTNTNTATSQATTQTNGTGSQTAQLPPISSSSDSSASGGATNQDSQTTSSLNGASYDGTQAQTQANQGNSGDYSSGFSLADVTAPNNYQSQSTSYNAVPQTAQTSTTDQTNDSSQNDGQSTGQSSSAATGSSAAYAAPANTSDNSTGTDFGDFQIAYPSSS
jgi:hypothetical protein